MCWELSQTLMCVDCVRLYDSELKDGMRGVERPGAPRWGAFRTPSFPNVSNDRVSVCFVNNKVSGECGSLSVLAVAKGSAPRWLNRCQPWGQDGTSPLLSERGAGNEAPSRLPGLGSEGRAWGGWLQTFTLVLLHSLPPGSYWSQDRARSVGAWTTATQ